MNLLTCQVKPNAEDKKSFDLISRKSFSPSQSLWMLTPAQFQSGFGSSSSSKKGASELAVEQLLVTPAQGALDRPFGSLALYLVPMQLGRLTLSNLGVGRT